MGQWIMGKVEKSLCLCVDLGDFGRSEGLLTGAAAPFARLWMSGRGVFDPSDQPDPSPEREERVLGWGWLC